MIAVIDTSSLLSLVRYYLPFDTDGVLYDSIKTRIQAGELLIIDRVYEECRYVGGGVVAKRLNYLGNRDFRKSFKQPIDTQSLLAPSPSRFMEQVDHNFVRGNQKNLLTQTEYESEKSKYLNSADCNMIILCLD